MGSGGTHVMQAVITDPFTVTLVKHAMSQLKTPCGSNAALCGENTIAVPCCLQ